MSNRIVVALSYWAILGCFVTSHAGAQVDYKPWTIGIDTVTPWSAAESGWGGRLVIGEYATADFCGECQLDDDIYNSLLKRYPRTAFISLAYHVGLGLPITDITDPNHLLKRLRRWYGDADKDVLGEVVKKPTFFNNWLDGNINLDCGKPEEVINLAKAVDAELKRPPEAFLQVQTRVDHGRIIASVKVDSITGKHKKTYLRLVVVEDTVHLVADGQYEQPRPNVAQLPRQVHHMVVRADAHTKTLSLGLPLRVPGTIEYTFDMAAVQSRFVRYHKFGIDSIAPWDFRTWQESKVVKIWNPDHKKSTEEELVKFPDERDWRMDPLRLHVVAFVQDAESAEVLQAVMVQLDPAQARRLLPAKVPPTLILKTHVDSTLANYWGYRELKD